MANNYNDRSGGKHMTFDDDHDSSEYNARDSFKRKNNEEDRFAFGKRQRFGGQNDNKPRFENWNSEAGRMNNWNSNKNKKWQDAEQFEEYFEDVPRPEKPRKYTISIAVPASILEETCKKDELRTYVVGQLARAANIYSVDEIIVYDDKCWRKKNVAGTGSDRQNLIEMMRMLLEYQECPQYLRKYLFSFHRFLGKVGVLNALNAPHHLLSKQWCEYREGVVLDRRNKSLSYVDVGLSSEITIDKKLDAGVRVTVRLPPETKDLTKRFGVVVSPDEPREKCGYYWGYTVRVAHSLTEVMTGGRFQNGYDLLIGTSDKGEDIKKTEYPKFYHALIVFGGVEGLESAIEADDQLEATEPHHLFDFYTNTCPMQQARTIRTEEAVLISLCALQDKLLPKGKN